MLNLRFFLGNKLTREALDACDRSGVNPRLVNEQLVSDLIEAGAPMQEVSLNTQIRSLFERFADRAFVKSHLALLFSKHFSQISRILLDPERGSRARGRPRALTREQENEVVEFVRTCQRNACSATFHDVTSYINDILLEGTDRKVSVRFVSKNNYIMSHFDTGPPSYIEDLRLRESTYENFTNFFNRYLARMSSTQYDRDLILNVDETTTNAEMSASTVFVLYDPEINVDPMVAVEGKKEHVTLCCGISVSGKKTIPSFIIKNKTVSAEQSLLFSSFDHGPYMLQYSPNGWQDTVNDEDSLLLYL